MYSGCKVFSGKTGDYTSICPSESGLVEILSDSQAALKAL